MTNWVIRGHPRLQPSNHTLRSKDKNNLAKTRGGADQWQGIPDEAVWNYEIPPSHSQRGGDHARGPVRINARLSSGYFLPGAPARADPHARHCFRQRTEMYHGCACVAAACAPTKLRSFPSRPYRRGRTPQSPASAEPGRPPRPIPERLADLSVQPRHPTAGAS